MGEMTISRNNRLDRDYTNYTYTIKNGSDEQSLKILTRDPESPMISMNTFSFRNDNVYLLLSAQTKSITIKNNNDKLVSIINDEIVDVKDYYDDELQFYYNILKPDRDEYIILTDDGKDIKEIYKKGLLNSYRIIYNYDELGRRISKVQYKNDSAYGYTTLYQYDDKGRVTRLLYKASKTIISDVRNEYVEVPDQEVINEFTRFFNILGINRQLLINQLNSIDISLYDNINKHDLRSVVK